MPPPPTTSPRRGDYAPAHPNDLRSPCPAINALANHGYLPRDGRNVRASELLASLNEFGLSGVLRFLFTHPIFLEQRPKDAKPSWWSILTRPFAYLFGTFGMRRPGQKDSAGVPCLNLDQLGLHNVVEHDVSLTRLDFAQGDNSGTRPELVEELLGASGNGRTITMEDFVGLRRRRYEKQRADNPELEFGGMQEQLACGEVALLLKVFGDSKEVPVSYMRAFFQQGRLPREEGWVGKRWWTVGLMEVNFLATSIKKILGPPGK